MSYKNGISALVLILLLHQVLAIDSGAEPDLLTSEAGVTLGTNPDDFSYKWGSFWNQVSYSLTFNKEAKAQKGLQIARRHLWEVKVFSEKRNLEKVGKAQEKYTEWISKVKKNAEELSSDDPKTELEQNVRLNLEFEKEGVLLEEVRAQIESSSELSLEEKERISALVEKAVSKKEEARQSVENRQEKVETKFKARFGLKEKELKSEVKRLESRKESKKELKETKIYEDLADKEDSEDKEIREREEKKKDKETKNAFDEDLEKDDGESDKEGKQDSKRKKEKEEKEGKDRDHKEDKEQGRKSKER
ncbi:MAG TPA: DUF5667 domain-containing protein [Candidatus Nanoarchaeia archaeon]|nr:DUF5667 domain-containing protein [Candidatus Nanoarchaeia archaeon]